MRLIGAAAMVLLMASSPAALADPAQTGTAPVAAPLAPAATPATPAPTVLPVASAGDPDEIVCRAGTPTTGTRIPGSRVCRTRHEWDQMRLDSQATLMNQQTRGLTAGQPGGN